MRAVVLDHETDWDGWREATRALVLAGVPPDAIHWNVAGEAEDLYAERAPLPDAKGSFNVLRALVQLAQLAIQARDPERFALLYRLVWRAHQGERHLLEQAADPEVARANRLALSVVAVSLKKKAFLRFRAVEDPEGARYVGWFEPEHYVLEANALFFAERFGSLCWSVLTPYRSAHWNGSALSLGPGAQPSQVPDDDALEGYWRSYYASVFNPARLNPRAMASEMPRKYWRNLPEAAAIPDLIRSATGRVEAMLEQELRPPDQMPLGPVRARSSVTGPQAPETRLGQAAQKASHCRACHLWERATQTVFGEGPADAQIMLIGEQPGDQEDLIGRPFVGPAGRLMDRALEEAGIDRRSVYVTNAVKHFKFEPRGKRRIHQKPEGPEILACKQWLDVERTEVRPLLMVLMGATAARAVIGRAVTIGRERGRRIALGAESALVTVHPSYLLRLPDEASKAREYRAFVADLTRAREIASELAAAK
ncbi:MAG: UdgX family uracil-DNA binding protein [Acetobacteraceae bacterium]|nr:UdgX family uracil-DNA binding protein [Acetobacteraceae bacterium]